MLNSIRQFKQNRSDRKLLEARDGMIRRAAEIEYLAAQAYHANGCQPIEVGPVRAAGTRRSDQGVTDHPTELVVAGHTLPTPGPMTTQQIGLCLRYRRELEAFASEVQRQIDQHRKESKRLRNERWNDEQRLLRQRAEDERRREVLELRAVIGGGKVKA